MFSKSDENDLAYGVSKKVFNDFSQITLYSFFQKVFLMIHICIIKMWILICNLIVPYFSHLAWKLFGGAKLLGRLHTNWCRYRNSNMYERPLSMIVGLKLFLHLAHTVVQHNHELGSICFRFIWSQTKNMSSVMFT